MRVIKFRVFCKKRDRWEYYTLGDPVCGETTESDSEGGEFDSKTWSQFTGLHDKNGREIYEGDVVRFDYPEILEYTFSGVVGVDRYNQWRIRISPEDKEKYGFRTGEFHIDNAVNRGEVAGNIHDTWK